MKEKTSIKKTTKTSLRSKITKSKSKTLNINDYIKHFKLNKKKIILLDVRESDEYQQKHIPNSINLPLSMIEYTDINFDHKKEIYVYCNSGNRSELAKDYLEKLDYKVVNIGGIMNLKNSK